MELISAPEAAGRLGVSERQVRRLAEAGEVPARRVGGRWLIDAEAVRRRSRSAPRPGRPLSPGMGWIILAALSSVVELDEAQPKPPVPQPEDRRIRYRVRALLAEAPPLEQWHNWLRRRATFQRVWVHPGVIDSLADDHRVHRGGGYVIARSGLGIAGASRPCFYVNEHDFDELLVDHRARRSDQGQVDMMVVPDEVSPEALGEPGEPVSAAAALVDLLASSDARERHVAAAALDRACRSFVGSSPDGGLPS